MVALPAVLLPFAANAATDHPLRIDEAVQLALARNEAAKIADAQVVVADAAVEKARAAFLPTIVGVGTDVQHAVTQPANIGTASGTFSLPLLNAPAWPLYRQAQRLLDAQRATSTDAKRLLSFSAANAPHAGAVGRAGPPGGPEAPGHGEVEPRRHPVESRSGAQQLERRHPRAAGRRLGGARGGERRRGRATGVRLARARLERARAGPALPPHADAPSRSATRGLGRQARRARRGSASRPRLRQARRARRPSVRGRAAPAHPPCRRGSPRQ